MRRVSAKPAADAATTNDGRADFAKRGVGLAAIMVMIVAAWSAGLLQPLDDGLAELRFRTIQRPASGDLAVVEIDTASVRAAGQWPWTRDRYATAIQNLQAAGAKVVGFDLDFSAPSSPDADRRLEAAVGARPGAVILPTFVQPRSKAEGAGVLESSPLAGLAANAVLASVNVPVDEDGRVRRYAYGFEAPSGQRLSMGAQLTGSPPGGTGTFLVDYGIRVEETPRLSFQDVYEGRFDPAQVRGRSVLIGATALELGDEFATPRFGILPGVYVHALGYESLASGRDLKRLHPFAMLLLALLVVWGLRPRRDPVSLRRLLLAHVGVAAAAVALPFLVQAVLPLTLEVGPVLLGQVLVLIWSLRSELNRRARAVIEARELHLVQLAEHMRKSRNKIKAANKKLRASNSALDKALKARTEFLASTSHEIRTPLNGILGMTQVILADARLETGVRQKVAVVQSAGETMMALVDDILDVAKIENGHMVITPAEMDLRRLLDEAAQLWSAKAGEKGVALRIDSVEAPGWISEDVTRLRQIVFNLMSNAIKFTEAGEVALIARAEGRRGRETLVLEVSDSGIGIPADKLEEIFESFRQVDGSVTRKYGGTGLGLAISRQLAVAMGGALSVRSTLGEGSVFSVRLPLRRVEGRETAAPAPQAGFGAASVLLVEANPLAQGVLKAALGPHVAHVEAVGSLEAALSALAARRVGLVLAEGATLAQGDGDAAAAMARLAAQVAGARISVLWGGPPEEIARLMTAGAAQVVRKPIATGELVSELKSLWERADLPLAVAS
jgi:signal transduction histidine kinase/CheY-like chemotaxis protein